MNAVINMPSLAKCDQFFVVCKGERGDIPEVDFTVRDDILTPVFCGV